MATQDESLETTPPPASPAERARRRNERQKQERIAHRNALRGDLEAFEAEAGMSAEFFCEFVRRRRSEGATFAMIVDELDDPRRSIKFTEETVQSVRKELAGKLNRPSAIWDISPLDTPAIPPKPPTKVELPEQPEHPVGIPYIRAKRSVTLDASAAAPGGPLDMKDLVGRNVTREPPVPPVRGSLNLSKLADRITEHRVRTGAYDPAGRDPKEDDYQRPRL